jgi:hypothetical protein
MMRISDHKALQNRWEEIGEEKLIPLFFVTANFWRFLPISLSNELISLISDSSSDFLRNMSLLERRNLAIFLLEG